MFKKYPSIEDSYRKKFIDGFLTMYPELLTAATYIVTEKVHGCLPSNGKVRLPDGSWKNMANIKEGDVVLGVDMAHKKVVPNRVIQVHQNGRGKQWLTIGGTRENAGRGGNEFIIHCTPEHRFWLTEQQGFVQAHALTLGDKVLSVRTDLGLAPLQEQVILGKLLGDGSLARSTGGAALWWSHSIKQIDYFNWTARALGELDAGRCEEYTSGYGSQIIRGRTVFNYAIRECFGAFVTGDRKSVPAWVADRLDPIAIAFWYMDDGSLTRTEGQEDRAAFAVCAFNEEDCQILIKGLYKFGIDAKYTCYDYPRLVLRADDADRLFLLVAPYVPPSMQHKLPERYRGHAGWLPKPSAAQYKSSLIEQEITSIEWESPLPTGKLRYDLETETGNYFAHGILVHNSNFQIYFKPLTPWRYGKRTAFLKEGEKFYNVHNVVQQYVETFEDIQDWVDHSLGTVRLFGELYGPGIQKGVSYGTEKRIGFYDMMVNDELLAPVDFATESFIGLQQNALPIVAMVTGLQAALDFNVEFNSLLNPIEGNVCEGVVIAPLARVYYNTRGNRFCLKKKNEKFKEKVQAPRPPTDPIITRLNLEFRTYITDNRLQSIFSQYGEIEEPSQIGEYIKFVLNDAKEDYLKDFSEEVVVLPQSGQRKVFNVGSMIALMLKKHL